MTAEGTSESSAQIVLRLPNAAQPADSPQGVIQFVLQGLRSRCFTSDDQALAAFRLRETLQDIGYGAAEANTLGRFLQKTGLVVRISAREQGQYVWFIAQPKWAADLPTEALAAAWREMRSDINTTARLRQLTAELETLTRITGGDDTAFMAEIGAKVLEITRQREQAEEQVEELKAQVEELKEKLAAKPAVTKTDMLEWITEMAKSSPQPAPKTRRSKR